jgi:hypothetical protein
VGGCFCGDWRCKFPVRFVSFDKRMSAPDLKKAKRADEREFSVVFEVDESLPKEMEDALQKEQDVELFPGFSCCGVCLKTSDSLAMCRECDRVLLCLSSDCAAKHQKSNVCDVLAAVNAVDNVDDEVVDDVGDLRALVERLKQNPVLGWARFFGDDRKMTAAKLKSVWLQTELLSGAIALMTALRTPSLRSTLNLLKKNGKNARVHFVGVEDELCSAFVWQWLWGEMLHAPNVAIVGIGPEILKCDEIFETHSMRYEDFCQSNSDAPPLLTVLFNPGFVCCFFLFC